MNKATTLPLLFALLLSLISLSLQAQDVLDQIAKDACGCIGSMEKINDPDKMQMKMGLCLYNAAYPYAAQLKKEHQLNMDQFNGPTGERLGEMIASRLLSNCPSFVTFLEENAAMFNEETKSETPNIQELSGKFVGLEEKQFYTILIEDERGKVHRLLWQEHFENATSLQGNKAESLKSKPVRVTFEEREYFEPRLQQYIVVKIIRGIQQI